MATNIDRFHVVTALWGAQFVDRFLSTTAPSSLAPNNLPAIAKVFDIVYTIYTNPEEAEAIQASALFNELNATVELRFDTSDENLGDAKYSRATNMYRRALRQSAAMDAPTIILTPDAIWSDGSLLRVTELANEGYRAVIADGLRVIRESFMPDLAGTFSTERNGAISAEPGKLMALALDHIHPFEAVATWGNAAIHDVPYRLHWLVPGEGILSRGFCGHPLLIHPVTADFDFVGAIDHGLAGVAISDSQKIFYPSDTSEIAVVSIDELGFSSKNIKPTDRRGRLLDTAKWAYHHATGQNLDAMTHACRRHNTVPATEKWHRVEMLSRLHTDAILNTRKMLAVMFELEKRGATKASAILAYALNELGLSGALTGNTSLTILVPSDDAMTAIDPVNLDYLTSEQGRADLRKIILAHALVGAVKAEDASEGLAGNRILEGNIEVEDWLVHIIDKPILNSLG